MEYLSNTVDELRKIANQNGLVGYTKLRKAELIWAIRVATKANDVSGGAVVRMNNLLDAPIPDIKGPSLKPSKLPQKKWHKGVLESWKNKASALKNKLRSEINSFSDWLISYVPPKIIKPVNEKLESFKSKVADIFNKLYKHKFELRETAAAIR